MTPEAAVAAALATAGAEGPVGVAVSGGGDSMALLHAAHRACDGRQTVIAATVDHGLRPESAGEARDVARACATLGIAHDILRWDGAGRGNLQARARAARRQLLGDWARGRGAGVVLLGHTEDDQAETVLLALARGSGVDGLAGMPALVVADGLAWLRPLLGLPREALRVWLRAEGIGWAEDPSNEDPRFARVRARRMLGELGTLGLTRERLARTAGHMARARASLDRRAAEAAGRLARSDGADLLLPLRVLAALEEGDTSARLVAAALLWVGGRERRPRWEDLGRLRNTVTGGRTATLAGCKVTPEGEEVRFAPEAGRAWTQSRTAGGFAAFVAGGAAEPDRRG